MRAQTNLHDQNASIVVIDDGEGMGAEGLRQHRLIGVSNKRRLGDKLPRGRQQIGRFGIGKLGTTIAQPAPHAGRRWLVCAKLSYVPSDQLDR